MGCKNGYFQLIRKEDGLYLKMIPPVNGGREIKYEDVSKYLAFVQVKDYDIKALSNGIKTLTEVKEVKLGDQIVSPIEECVLLEVSEDRMTLTGTFYPPSTEGSLMTKEDIISDIMKSKIKFGLIEENVGKFIKEREYCTDIILAKGLAPIQGKSAEITYHFNTDKNTKPKVNEDGSVDFHQLDMISSVSKGDILATLKKVDYGRPGIDVMGSPVKPIKVSNAVLKHGINIHLSEDGCTMYSDVAGHVQLEGDKVFVSNTYEVPANVDTSTGDITYEGNVHVKGNVITGFSIRAKGDIEVDGVVEGATLIADGQIILKRGIQGMSRGKLVAKGNIIAKFIESSEVISGGYVSAEAAMHSKISATGDILVDGRNGSVTGGVLRSGTMICLKTAGSTMGTNTLLEVGIDPALIDEYHGLEKKIQSMETDKEKLSQMITLLSKKLLMGEKLPEDKIKYLQVAKTNVDRIEKEIEKANDRYDRLQIEIENTDGGKIKVSNIAYPGVKIIISNVVYFVRSNQHYCQFVKDRADIKVIPL